MRTLHKSVYVGFRLARSEYASLVAMTEQEDRPVSEMLREIIRQAAVNRGVWAVQEAAQK